MPSSSLIEWLTSAPAPLLAAVAAMEIAAFSVGAAFRKRRDSRQLADEPPGAGLEGVFLSAVLGLLALLMGFTFSIALNRFDDRRSLVLEEANAIGTTYLRTQLLGEPHRTRITGLLIAYTDNRIALAAATRSNVRPLRAENDRLINELWAATSAASDNTQALGLTTAYLSSMNQMIDLEAARRVARNVRVPAEVFVVLIVYLLVTAGTLGYVSTSRRDRISASAMFVLLTLSLMLILDVDRPISGGIREDQAPMTQLRASLKSQSPGFFDHYRVEDGRTGATARPPPDSASGQTPKPGA